MVLALAMSRSLWGLVCSLTGASAIQVLGNSVLGPNPSTVNHLNGESYQQDAIITFQGLCSCASLRSSRPNIFLKVTSTHRYGLKTPPTRPFATLH